MSDYAELTAQTLTVLLQRIWREINGNFTAESAGLFLESGVILGGELTVQPQTAAALHVSEAVVSFAGELLRVGAKDLTPALAGASVYYLDFTKENGLTFGNAHPKESYLPLWTVSTDASGKVAAVEDRRGGVGTVKLREGLLDVGAGRVGAILTATLPKPDVKLRGQTCHLLGAAGRPDEIYQCVKLGNEAYDWVQIK